MVRLYIEDLLELAERDDARGWWLAGGPSTREIIEPLSVATRTRLSGVGDDGSLELATLALARHIEADDSRLGAVARRPLRRIITALERLPPAPSLQECPRRFE